MTGLPLKIKNSDFFRLTQHDVKSRVLPPKICSLMMLRKSYYLDVHTPSQNQTIVTSTPGRGGLVGISEGLAVEVSVIAWCRRTLLLVVNHSQVPTLLCFTSVSLSIISGNDCVPKLSRLTLCKIIVCGNRG
jgi:hypothetical protein